MNRYRKLFCNALWMAAFQLCVAQAQVPLSFVPVTPCRVVDTRLAAGPFGGPSIVGSASRSFPIPSGSCNIPAGAAAYSFNATVVPHNNQPVYFILVWPTGQPQPLASSINSFTGLILANGVIVPAGTNGAVSVYVSDTTDVLLDIDGYFVAPTITATQTTALGTGASTAGSQNTAIGFNALQVNSTGNGNTATGSDVLSSNISGANNVGVGAYSMLFNASGSANTALGSQALLNNLIGGDNTAIGFSALWSNVVGTSNTAAGVNSLMGNTTGSYNAALGQGALSANTDGSWNIALGYNADSQASNGNYNIEIGNQGTSADSGTIRIGSSGNQTSTFIAGINGVSIASGSAVLINSNGQLGVSQSSERYKEDIHDMDSASDALMQLRPITFRYKRATENGAKPLQYGLVAEEVAKIFPELVVYDKNGQVESVQYQELPALLLNELQKQRQAIERQNARIAEQENEIRAYEARTAALEKLLQKRKH